MTILLNKNKNKNNFYLKFKHLNQLLGKIILIILFHFINYSSLQLH